MSRTAAPRIHRTAAGRAARTAGRNETRPKDSDLIATTWLLALLIAGVLAFAVATMAALPMTTVAGIGAGFGALARIALGVFLHT